MSLLQVLLNDHKHASPQQLTNAVVVACVAPLLLLALDTYLLAIASFSLFFTLRLLMASHSS